MKGHCVAEIRCDIWDTDLLHLSALNKGRAGQWFLAALQGIKQNHKIRKEGGCQDCTALGNTHSLILVVSGQCWILFTRRDVLFPCPPPQPALVRSSSTCSAHTHTHTHCPALHYLSFFYKFTFCYLCPVLHSSVGLYEKTICTNIN